MYVPRVESSGKGCGQEEDLGLVRTASMVAVRGSSSSDPNPSDSSVECDCCKQSTDLGQVDSNKSTYGSSDIKDSSDVSSYNSNFTPDKSPPSSDSEKWPAGQPDSVAPGALAARVCSGAGEAGGRPGGGQVTQSALRGRVVRSR